MKYGCSPVAPWRGHGSCPWGRSPENGSNPMLTFCHEELTVGTRTGFSGNPEEEDGSAQRRCCLTWIGRMSRKSSWWGVEERGPLQRERSLPVLAHSRRLPFLLLSGPELIRVPEESGDLGGPLWMQGRGMREESLKGPGPRMPHHTRSLEPQLPYL